MQIMRPNQMLELGVCSGVSSSFLLYAAQRLKLINSNHLFLESFDAVAIFEEQRVGQVVNLNFPELAANWRLNVNHTASTLLTHQDQFREKFKNQCVLAFVDAEHRHPWPLLDILILSNILPDDSGILIQDVCLTERWLANSLERGVECPDPCRGVQLV